MHFIDFNKFYKDNFLYREIRANVTLNKAEKVLKIKVDNLKIDFEMYDENFWEYIYSATGDPENVYAIFKDENGFSVIDHPLELLEQCNSYKSNLDENFLFLVHNYSDENDVIENFVFSFSVKNTNKILNLFTGYKYSKDFIKDYNSFKGSAFGIAHTLFQTAIFRPKNFSKKVDNLFYVGHHTNPGIGMPPVIISSQIVYNLIKNEH
jgi:hypothetical protein